MSGDASVWYYVKHDDGDVQRLSLEQLDVAFQAGFIDAETRVLADGGGWTTLGRLAGLDEAPAPVRPRAHSRTAIAPGPLPASPPTAARSPAAYAPTARAFVAPPQMYSPPALPSHRPVSVDLGVLDAAGQSEGYASQPPTAARGRKWGWAIGVTGLAILGAAATVVVRQPAWASPVLGRIGMASAAQAPAEPQVQWPSTPAATPAPPAETAAATTAAPSPEPQVPSTSAAVPAPVMADTHADDVDGRGRSSKNQHGAHAKTHHGRGPTPRPHTPPKKGSSSFTTDGNKFDPLNSSI